MSNFEKKHTHIRDNVKDICAKYPSTVGDYRKLVQYYWYYVDGLKNFIPLELLEKITQPESITRAFRKAIELGEIEPTDEQRLRRDDEEQRYRKYYRK